MKNESSNTSLEQDYPNEKLIPQVADFEEFIHFAPCAYSFNRPKGDLRAENQDFIVEEVLSFIPSDEGEHLFLYLQKEGCNTDWLAKQLQTVFSLRSQDIGYAGKKDRYSVSSQWFSLHLPGSKFSEQEINSKLDLIEANLKLLKHTRHNKKLRKGSIRCNRFEICIRNLSSPILKVDFEKLVSNGFPNYFGYQRFGREGANLRSASKLLNGEIKVRSKNKKGLYLSAARSLLFNVQLSHRIKAGTWNSAIEGDCFNLNATRSFFNPFGETHSELAELNRRIETGDIHVSGYVPGDRPSNATANALLIETESLAPFKRWVEGLKRQRVESARRAFRVIPMHTTLAMDGNGQSSCRLAFELPSGTFVTSLLRELCDFVDLAGEGSRHNLSHSKVTSQEGKSE